MAYERHKHTYDIASISYNRQIPTGQSPISITTPMLGHFIKLYHEMKANSGMMDN